MNKEDYFKYYIQGSDHYLIPKDVFDELFDEMESWKQDTNKYKEVIDKAIDLVEKLIKEYKLNYGDEPSKMLLAYETLLNTLREVE